MRDMSKILDNYLYSPNEMISAVNSYLKFAGVDIRDIIANPDNSMGYFRNVYKWESNEEKLYQEKLMLLLEEKKGTVRKYYPREKT